MEPNLDFSEAALGTPAYGDLVLENGDIQMADGQQALKVAILCAARTFLGEFFLDQSLGVPYYQELLGQKEPTSGFEIALQNVILAVPGVVALLAWSAVRDAKTRRLALSFTAQSTDGIINWAGDATPTAQGG